MDELPKLLQAELDFVIVHLNIGVILIEVYAGNKWPDGLGRLARCADVFLSSPRRFFSSLKKNERTEGSEEDSRTQIVVRRKCDERNSSGSSSGIPPTKSAKTLEELNNNEDDGNVWMVLNKIQRNTDELLEENRALRKQYEELKQSIEFNNSKLESLEQENKNLKEENHSVK